MAKDDIERIERQVDGQRYAQTIERVASPSPELSQRLKDATTLNLDAPGLAPVAADAANVAAAVVRAAGGGEGVVVAVSEGDAAWSFDGYPPELVMGGKTYAAGAGWTCAAKKLAAGVHSVRVQRDRFFPVETQVLVRPGVYEVLAVRLGKIVMRSGGIK